MKTSSSSPNETVALIGVLLIITGLATAYFYLLPQYVASKQDRIKNENALATVNADLDSASQAKTSLSKGEKALANRGINADTLASVIPPTEDMPGLYIQMEAIVGEAAGAGVNKPSYQLSTPIAANAGGGVHIPISVTGSGSYASLKQYLSFYEKNIRPVTFTDVTISTAAAPVASGGTSGSSSTSDNGGPVTLTANGYIESQGVSPAYTLASPTP